MQGRYTIRGAYGGMCHLQVRKSLGVRSSHVEVKVVPLPRMPVTTRTIIFLVGDPELNLHLPLESWEGGQPNRLVTVQMVSFLVEQ